MPIVFYNTLTRVKEEFKPHTHGVAKIYTCGPTVYSFVHIGNLRAFLFYDLLRRYLKYRGFEVKHVMNITDVDDKTIRDSKKEGLSLRAFTEKYTKIFFDDLKAINIETFELYPKATDHIPEMVEMVKTLMHKGFAYKGSDGSIYFDISKFEGYGKLSGTDVSQLKVGARVSHDEYAKDEAQDFALWKAWTPEDGDVFWETELGRGRPGWHIECSAMSMKYLGHTIDIHGGGVDLVFPHHENEIAQSEAATGKPFVKYWLHNEHLLVEGKKMSKSLGNFFTLRDLIKNGHKPVAVRYALISTHYRSKLNVTDKALWDAQQGLDRIYNFMDLLSKANGHENHEVEKLIEKTRKGFEERMDDDLDINGALVHVFDFIRDINIFLGEDKVSRKDAEACTHLMKKLDKVLGILKEQEVTPEFVGRVFVFMEKLREDLDQKDRKAGEHLDKRLSELRTLEPGHKLLDEMVTMVAEIREELRKKKEYNLSDMIRAELNELGIILEDSAGPGAARWRMA